LAIATTLAAATALAYGLGRSVGTPEASAVPPRPVAVQSPAPTPTPATAKVEPADPARIIAVFGNNVQITRQEFGEYLIARDSKRLEQFINKRILEQFCQERGVSVTDAEMDAQILEDLGKMNIDPKQLLDQVLSHYNMTFYEWREDVIRPQLMMKKIVQNMVSVTAEDLRDAYEAEFGEKRECRIIIWREGIADQDLYSIYEKITNKKDAKLGEAEFERAARTQADPGLAACGGHLNKPLSRHSLAKKDVEERVFRLNEGEVTEIIQDGKNKEVFKCDRIIPPVENPPPLETVRDKYVQIIIESKIRDKIPEVCKELRKKADVHPYLNPPDLEKEWLHRAELAINAAKKGSGK
jgi:hypothetical protein